MAFELEALVGHLYIVGGRVINVNPPGSLVEVAPPDAAKGREGDTFFLLIVPSGSIAPTTFYQQLSTLAAERYFSLGGNVTTALRGMFQLLNRNLYEHNLAHSESQEQQFETSMIAAVLHEDDMYVARVGPVVSVLQTAGLTLSFPEDLTDDEPLFSVPLGLLPEPEISMVRYGVNAGSRLLLSDGNLADIPVDRLTSVLLENDIEKVLHSLRRTIKIQSQLMLVELVPPEYESAVLAAPGESSREISMKLGAARQELDLDGEQWKLPRRGDFGSLLGWGLARVARRVAGGLLFFSDLFQRFFPLPEVTPTRRLSSGTLILTVLLIPLVIVSMVVLSWVSNLGETEFEQCLGKLQDTASLARSIDTSNRRSVTSAWNATLQMTDACEVMRQDDPAVAAMREEAQTLIDAINNVKRREAYPLTNFEDAVITRLRLQDANLYALDDKNDLVYSIKLSDDGTEPLQQEPIPMMRIGATHEGGYTIGQIVDIAFDDHSGDLAMLDRNGTLVRCAPQFILNCDAQQVLNANNWERPIALTIWARKLYILDSEDGQIWRYDPSGSSYASAPREYFSGSARPNLRNVVDFTISRRGTVYVLYGDGVMKSYIGGNEAPYVFSGFNEGSEPHVVRTDGFYLNDSPFAPGFFLISRRTRTIFETTVAGTFMDSYQAFDQEKLGLVSAVVAYPEQNLVYVASGNTIFRIMMNL
ncbi:MAG: hypothetical protein OXI34_13740 [Chloroflexota bacterium]|nr:hypothetical protein [Chloroflexota bacterium]MDE2947978.1 hypothetical protein [Chloroflexota bacterium]